MVRHLQGKIKHLLPTSSFTFIYVETEAKKGQPGFCQQTEDGFKRPDNPDEVAVASTSSVTNFNAIY